jgi:hydrogenase maturation protease
VTAPVPAARRVLVIGIGNAYRGDDAAGLAVAEWIRAAAPPDVAVVRHEGEPISLLETWDQARDVYLVDAVSSDGEPGNVYRFDAAAEPLAARLRPRGTHALGVADTIELARALGRLPRRLVSYGIEGRCFATGASLSAPVREAVAVVSERLLAELTPPALVVFVDFSVDDFFAVGRAAGPARSGQRPSRPRRSCWAGRRRRPSRFPTAGHRGGTGTGKPDPATGPTSEDHDHRKLGPRRCAGGAHLSSRYPRDERRPPA